MSFVTVLVPACMAVDKPLRSGDGSDVQIKIGILDSGLPARAWLEAIKDRISRDEMKNVRAARKQLNGDEEKWLKQIRNILSDFSSGGKELGIPLSALILPGTS